MSIKKLIPLFLLLLVVCVGRGLACSCVPNGTVDTAFEKADNIVIMKLRGVEKAAPGEPSGVEGIRGATLSVEKTFKGNLRPGQMLKFEQGQGGNCVWFFSESEVDEEYLLYLGPRPKDGLWRAHQCTRSNSKKGGAADILYLENREKAAGRTRLSGILSKRIESPIDEQPSSWDVLPRWNLEITGNGKTYKLKTDENGVYEIYDLPPGEYTLRPEPIFGYVHDLYSRVFAVDIGPSKQAEKNFTFYIDNVVRGKFSDAKGDPLKDICLKLVPAAGTPHRNFFKFDCTDPDGSFEIKNVPAGSYLILFNYDDTITSTAPFRSFYYPQARKREDAAVIQIAPGTKIEDLIITAPETSDVVTINGTLRMSDGKTANKDNAEYAAVQFIAEGDEKATDISPTSRANIDADGRFTIRILKGQVGRLYGTVSVYSGKYQNCPQIDKLLPKKEGYSSVDIKTEPVSIKAEADQTGVDLVFPFPSCKPRPGY